MITNLIQTHDYCDYDVECDICGFGPLVEYGEVLCSVPDSTQLGKYWQTHEACLDCIQAGAASFPSRLREYARAMEEKEPKKAEKLRELAKAEWSSIPGRAFAMQFQRVENPTEGGQSGND